MKRTCSKCGSPNDRLPQRYCTICHAANMRATRPKHRELSNEARQKASARSYLKEYVRRGHIKPEPCSSCGAMNSEAHHPDYDSPLCVHWLCRQCHLAEHKRIAEAKLAEASR